MSATTRAQGLPWLSVARRLTRKTPLSKPITLLHAFAAQQTRGDINIYPRFAPQLYRKLLSNPTDDVLRRFIREGERGAWRRLE
ncbi:DUF3336 domain-containing protein, partial [Myxococcota bacterium]|nr:DUF3336 domain-containing protein [Myxococcota bacterium]